MLPADEARHALRVLRLQPGDSLILLDGKGSAADAKVEQADRRDDLMFRVLTVKESPPPRVRLHLYVAPPRAKQMGLIIQQATELGFWQVTPVLTEFSVARPAGERVVEHWLADAVSAIKQSGNTFLPMIDEPVIIETALATCRLPAVLGDVEAAPCSFSWNGIVDGGEIGVWIGPEGGFSASERARLLQRGVTPVKVGSWILRVETAVPALAGFLMGIAQNAFADNQRQ